jgi:pimeloyl-ACP methyl ester carboxylesterase
VGSIVVGGFIMLAVLAFAFILIGVYRHSRQLAVTGGMLLLVLAIGWVGLPGLLQIGPGMSWTDQSPHMVRSVRVAPDVQLEVLDWGGSGRPLVFLSGLQDVAHGFDDFAPTFSNQYHVVGITRRGYGASSQPPSGYDVASRVDDLRVVLDSLGLHRVALVGHSIAGDELTGFAAAYPDRVIALVYLDAAYDHSDIAALLSGSPPPARMLAADSASAAAVQAYLLRNYGMRIPEAQLRAIGRYAPGGHLIGDVTPPVIDSLMLAGVGHPEYAAVRAPALVIDAVIDSMPSVFPAWRAFDSTSLAMASRFTESLQAWASSRREQVRRELKGAEVLELHGANHYVFASNTNEVAAAMRVFLEAHSQ